MDGREFLRRRYELLRWPMGPDDERAVVRFTSSSNLFRRLLSEHPSFEGIRGRGEVEVLDVCAGGGIAGAAMAKALVEGGKRVRITAVDAREEDLGLLEEWLRYADLLGSVEFETVVADATELPKVLGGRYDVSMIWGSSMPHFDPWRAAKMIAGIRELSTGEGVLLVEQRDIATRLLLTNQFRRILSPEGSVGEDGSASLSIMTGHDPLRGTVRRAYYSLPGVKFIGFGEDYLWRLSELAVLMWMFFEHVELLTGDSGKIETRYGGPVLIAWGPRDEAVPYDRLEFPEALRGST